MYFQDRNAETSRNTLTNYSQYQHTPPRTSHSSSHHSHISRPPSRPPSELLCEIHIYKVPPELWRESLNNILNNVVTKTVSVGIIRVPTETRLVDLRESIVDQLQLDDLVPRDYVFLRSVGRSLTRLRGKQEYQLKAKHFLPPVAYAPELYILEATPEMRDAMAISDRSSQSPPLSRRTSPSHRGYPASYRNGYPGDSDSERNNRPPRQPTSPANKYHPLPQIGPSPHRANDPTNRDFSSPDPHSNNYNSDDSSFNRYNNHYKPHNNNYNNNNNYHSKHNNPPQQEYVGKPTTEWDEQPETKQVVPAYHAAVHPSRNRSPSPSKRSPPRSADKGRDRRHDDDSGVAGLSPEDEYNRRNREEYDSRRPRDMQRRLDSERFGVDDESEAERRRRLEDAESMNNMDKQRWDADQEERRRRAEEDRRKMEEERRLKEERDKREREEEERRRREEDEKRRKEEEEERRKREEERRLREERSRHDDLARQQREEREKQEKERQEEEERLRNRNNQMSSPEPDARERDTESARQRRRDEKNQLLKDIEDARQARQDQEKEREELVKKAKQMQHKTTNRRNEARDMWKKKYFEEKKKTAPLEENSSRLQQELEALHKRLMSTLEGPKEKNLKLIDTKPSIKNNHIIQCTKLQHEIEHLQRRVENARMKLTSEMKLRAQAQTEMKAVRSEAMQNRLAVKLARSQQGQLGVAK